MKLGYQWGMVRLWVICAACILAACGRPRWDRPDEAYKAFSAAVRKGELQAAYAGLSSPSRQAIEARAKEVARASQGSVKDDPVLMLFASGYKPLPQGEVKVASENGPSAVVEVTVNGTAQTQRMSKEGERWTVDLADAFK